VATTSVITAAPAQRGLLRDPLVLWHLLSLDAPTVAALWTSFAAATFHITLPWTAPAALATAVWLLYAADRISDARQQAEPLQDRHRFHARHVRAFSVAMACAACLLCVLLVLLPAPLRTAWMLLALPLLGYVAAVHVLHGRVPKEALVGLFFASAILAPSLLARPGLPAFLSASLFGLLCWLNCIFIARAEHAPHHTMGRVSTWTVQNLPAACAALAAMAVVAGLTVPQALPRALAVLLSALLLLLLDALRSRTDAIHIRALADAALLTPLLVWPLLPHLQ
jgi:hypothetical protein